MCLFLSLLCSEVRQSLLLFSLPLSLSSSLSLSARPSCSSFLARPLLLLQSSAASSRLLLNIPFMEALFSDESTSSRTSKTKKFFKTLLLFWGYSFVVFSSVTQLLDAFEYMYEDVDTRSQHKRYKAIDVILPDAGNIPLFQTTFVLVVIGDAITRMMFSRQWIRGELQKPSDYFKYGTSWALLIPTAIVAMAGQYVFGGFVEVKARHTFLDMEGNPVASDDRYRRLDLVRKGRVTLVWMVASLLFVKILYDRCESSFKETQVLKDEKNEDSKNDALTVTIEPNHGLEKGQAEKH